MNALTFSNGGGDAPATMSTKEISDLTGKRHDHVMRDARKMLVELHGEHDLPKFGGVYQGGNGEQRPCLHLPKRETLILVSGYNLVMRAKIIDRWQELEAGNGPTAINVRNLPQLQTIALQLIEVNREQSEQIAEMTPKVEAFERLAVSNGSLCITDAAKTLGVRPKDLFDFLRSHGWIFSPHGARGDVAYQVQLQRGLMEHKTTTVHRSDGSEKVVTQARITPKGLARLAQEFPPPAKAA